MKLLIVILLLGFSLRFYNLTTFPGRGGTFDEYAWTWLGMNIIQQGMPISWSPHPQYQIKEHYVEPSGAAFWLVRPYLEHPPLFGLFAGIWALASGAKDMYNVSLAQIRPLSLVLGVFSIAMVYLLAKELYGKTVGLISALLYATIPTVVIGSRLLQNENFFIPLYLTSLWLIIRFLNDKRTLVKVSYLPILSAIICGLLTLAKVPWWSAAIGSLFVLIYAKKYKHAVGFLAIVASLFSLFFVWGIYWDKEVFFNLWRFQLTRYDITFDGIFSLFKEPFLANELYLDGWIYAGWFALFGLISNHKEHKFLLLGILGYFAIYIIGIPDEPAHGWYRYPFYPFLVIAIGYLLYHSYKAITLFPFFISSFAGLSLLHYVWEPIFGFSFQVYRSFLILCGLTSVGAVITTKRAITVSRMMMVLIFTLLIGFNIAAVILFK